MFESCFLLVPCAHVRFSRLQLESHQNHFEGNVSWLWESSWKAVMNKFRQTTIWTFKFQDSDYTWSISAATSAAKTECKSWKWAASHSGAKVDRILSDSKILLSHKSTTSLHCCITIFCRKFKINCDCRWLFSRIFELPFVNDFAEACLPFWVPCKHHQHIRYRTHVKYRVVSSMAHGQ